MATTSVKNAISNAMQSPSTSQGVKGGGIGSTEGDAFFGDHAVSTFVSSKSANGQSKLLTNTTPSLGNASSTTTSTLNNNNPNQQNIAKTDTAAEHDEEEGASSGDDVGNSPDAKGKAIVKKKTKKPSKPQ